jgi:hypothetical protein
LGSALVEAGQRMLKKLTRGVNFTNILQAAFLRLQFGFGTFGQKNIDAKAARKVLMKRTSCRHGYCTSNI